MHYAEQHPPEALDPWVECVWTLRGTGHGTDPVLPDGRTEIVLNFGDRFRRHTDGQVETQPRALFVGPMSRAAILEPGRTVDLLGIRLRPAAARTLLPTPMRELEDRIPALDDVAPRLARLLEDTGNAHDRVATALDSLRTILDRSRPPDPRLARVVDLIETARGDTTIDRAAAAAGWSARHLQRRFLDEVGLSPRTFARVIRVQAAARMAPDAPRLGWARIAATCGFFDQAHLIREFRSIAGRTPTTLFAGTPSLGEVFTGG